MESKKEFIKINICGKCLKSKAFNIKLNADIEVVKQLILARIFRKNKTIKPAVDKCFLITKNGLKLDNSKKIQYYYDNLILYDNCDLKLDIKIKNHYCKKNEFEFGQINMVKKREIANDFNVLGIRNIVRSVSNVVTGSAALLNNNEEKGEHKREGWYNRDEWYDDLSWDDKPINDEDWE